MRVLNKIISLILFASLLISQRANAWGIADVYKNLHTNVTKPGSYQDAAAGYYSGGGLSVRTKSADIRPFSMTAPSITTGCNGIDVYTGSFSMISEGELVNIAENIGSAAIVYGFHLGMKTYAPQIENTLKDLRNLQMHLNQLGLGRCVAAQAGFAAALPKNTAMYERVCSEMASGGGYDLGDQRKKCKDHQNQQAEIEKAQNKDKDLLLDNFNLFVKAADKASIPEDLRPSLMSMVGTIVIKDRVMTPYPPLITNKAVFDTYLNGGGAGTSYSCRGNDHMCLTININSNIEISQENSYSGIARRKLTDIREKIYAQDSELSNDDINFIDSIGRGFPVYDHILLEASTGSSILDSTSSEIAKYMLVTHLQSLAEDIRRSVIALKGKQIAAEHIDEYVKSLDRVLEFANSKYAEMRGELDRIDVRADKIEKHFMARERG